MFAIMVRSKAYPKTIVGEDLRASKQYPKTNYEGTMREEYTQKSTCKWRFTKRKMPTLKKPQYVK
jgi:hypothetical protein